jgi:8-oxo-dGTP pyrophosphatase MutT (NUDIX family)
MFSSLHKRTWQAMTDFFNKIIRLFLKIAFKLHLIICFLVRPTIYGVYIAVWYDDRILMIKNSYKEKLTIPCGRIKRREKKKEAAIRELREEVGIQAVESQLKLVGQISHYHEFKYDTGTVFEIHMLKSPRVQVDHREVVWAKFLSPAEALVLHLSPIVKSYLKNR